MAEAGRPRLLDDAKCREICALVVGGFDLTAAGHYVGCSRRTIQREIKRNEAFAEQLRRASMMCELEPLRSIRHQARSNWRAAAWYLERVNPHRFARRNPVYMTAEDVQEFMEVLVGIIVEEVRSEAAQKRIIRQIMKLSEEIDSAKFEHENTEPRNRPMSVKPKRSA